MTDLSFAGAFAKRTVLVTGHSGFKGAWLCIWLAHLGARIAGYALAPPTQPSLFEWARIRELLGWQFEADIRDAEAIRHAVETVRPDVVLHLAARTVVRESYAEPSAAFSVNVMGTALLLDAIRRLDKPCAVVVVSSDKCYANNGTGRPFDEDDPLGGDDPYSASKAAAELVTAAYRRSFFDPDRLAQHGVAVASARAGNVLGGGDWTADGLIADTVRACQDDRPVILRYPSAIRPWQHVLEPLAGYLTLADRLLTIDGARFCRGWNFGPHARDAVSVRQVVEGFLAAYGSGAWEAQASSNEPYEAHVLRLSTRRARAELEWRPRWGLAETLTRTASWYRRVLRDPRETRAACLDDLALYLDTAALPHQARD